MKKFFSMMMIAAAAFSFVACEGLLPDDDNKPVEGSKLETPVVEASEVGETYFTISWGAVEGADSYTINMKGKNYSTSETSYKFENLNKGDYTARVKATGAGYKDSDFGSVVVSLTGATSASWFTQTVELTEDGLGINFMWKGEDVVGLSYGLFTSDQVATADDQTIIANLQSLGSDETAILAEVNGDGFTAVFENLSGSTSYTMFAFVTNDNGVEYLARNEVTTIEVTPSDEAMAWIGTWTVKSHETYVIDQTGEGTVQPSEETFNIVISPSNGGPDEVVIDGWSVLGAGQGFVTYATVEGDSLYILNGTYLGDSNDGSFGYYWVGWYDFGLSIDPYPSNIATLSSANAATSTNEMMFQDNNGNDVPVVCYACDVFGVSAEGNIYFLIESFPGVYRTGAMDWTKTSNDPAQATRFSAGFNTAAIKSSVVLR